MGKFYIINFRLQNLVLSFVALRLSNLRKEIDREAVAAQWLAPATLNIPLHQLDTSLQSAYYTQNPPLRFRRTCMRSSFDRILIGMPGCILCSDTRILG